MRIHIGLVLALLCPIAGSASAARPAGATLERKVGKNFDVHVVPSGETHHIDANHGSLSVTPGGHAIIGKNLGSVQGSAEILGNNHGAVGPGVEIHGKNFGAAADHETYQHEPVDGSNNTIRIGSLGAAMDRLNRAVSRSSFSMSVNIAGHGNVVDQRSGSSGGGMMAMGGMRIKSNGGLKMDTTDGRSIFGLHITHDNPIHAELQGHAVTLSRNSGGELVIKKGEVEHVIPGSKEIPAVNMSGAKITVGEHEIDVGTL
jgi:hypothetical protein